MIDHRQVRAYRSRSACMSARPFISRHAHVEDGEVDVFAPRQCDGGAGLGLPGHLHAVAMEDLGDELTGHGVIVDDQDARHHTSNGSRTRTVVPTPGTLSTAIVPPCACTMWSTMTRPRPVPRPGAFVV